MPEPRRKLILVGWDSADWKIIQPLIDSGAMAGMARVVERGVSGNLTTLEPQLSPMLWTSIATGKMAYHHGVPGFTEVDPTTNKVVPVSAATRRASTLWEILDDHGLKSHVVSWFATHGERDHPGCLVSNMFGHVPNVPPDADPSDWPPPPPGTYWPERLAAAMNDLRVSPHDLDPDEVIRAFVPAAHTIDQAKDKRLWMLAQKLAEAFSVHEAATHLLATEPDWDLFAVYYRTVDEISHLFMPYNPPKMEGIPEADFELYQHVVTAIYRLHDLFLQRLVQLAGPDTAVMVISDHGFHSDHLRPTFTPRVPAGITVWHRPQGVFAAAGPGFRTDELVFGARLLDIAPTVLHWFGLPVGRDMEGRVLEEAFDPAAEPGGKRRPVATIATHEPPGGRHRVRAGFGEAADKALLDQFVALGYIDEIPADQGQAVAETRRENDWNMARALMHGQRFAEALPLLEGCFHACPFRTDYAQLLASCQMNLGLLAEADATVDRARDSFGQTERADLIKASIAIQRDDHRAALAALERVRETMPDDVQLGLMLARSYLGLRRFADADAAARHVLTLDPHNPQACLVQARIALHTGRPADAIDSALAAISLQYGNPMAHWLLAAALQAEGRVEEAEKPLRNCLALAPDFLRARRLLGRVLRSLGRREEAAAEEGIGFERARAARDRANRLEAECRAAAEVRAAARAEADRQKQAEALRKAAEAAAIEPLEILVVSGLPRSGTSLMMQILRAGGIEPMTDGQRVADEDNLEGYFEWEAVKQLPKNPRLIEQAEGKAVKVISALLPSLPAPHRYTIIYMVRPTEQVVDSQWAMLGRRGQAPRSEKRHLIEVQEQHSRQIRKALAASDRVTLLEVSYPELVADPAPVVDKLAALLPGRFTPSPAVAACIKPALHRNRGPGTA